MCMYVYVCMFSYISVHGYMYMYIKPPKTFLSYLNSMLKTNIDKNKNFNKTHVYPPTVIYN